MALDLQAHPLVLWTSALLSIYVLRTIKYRLTHKLPPGPMGIPLLGNVFQLSMTPWKEFEAWKKDYGALVYVTVAGQGILSLNTREAATALLDGRGALYADRPRFIMASEVMCGGLLMAIMGYNDLLRKMRRAGHEALSKAKVTEYYDIQSREAVVLVDEILRSPNDWETQVFRAQASAILSVVYDSPGMVSIKDPLLVKMEDFARALQKAGSSPTTFLVEFLPWLKHAPSSLFRWKGDMEERFKISSKMFEDLYHEVKNRINQGDERPSFVGTLVREQHRHGLSDSESAWLAAMLFFAGFETTSVTMSWFTLAMIAYPDKQRKCQEELDAVVGRSRVPTFKDREGLPYLQATVRELLRWRAVTPIAAPHYTKEDDWFQGYFIPKGTICLANVWCINRDKTVYGEDADDFNPDRFIDENGKLTPALPDTKDEGHVAYGFGPRLCLGRHMANNSLFLNIASLLWAANISPVKDETGKPIIPDTLQILSSELTARPLPFKCSITPRFPEATGIVAQSRELL